MFPKEVKQPLPELNVSWLSLLQQSTGIYVYAVTSLSLYNYSWPLQVIHQHLHWIKVKFRLFNVRLCRMWKIHIYSQGPEFGKAEQCAAV